MQLARSGSRLARGYSRLFAAGLINGIGDRFSSVAMLALLLRVTGSGMAVGIALGLRVLPYLFMAPLGGLLASRIPRRRLMIAVDLLRVPVALSFLLVDSKDMIWLLYLGSFVLAAGEAVYAPVRKSSIPLLAKPESLLRINSLEQLLTGCVLIVGAFAGGLISLWFGPDAAFIFNGISFLAAAMLLWGLELPEGQSASGEDKHRVEPAGSTETEERREAAGSRRRALAGVLAGSLVLQVVLAYECLVPLLNGWDNVLISVYAVQVFHAGDAGVGAFYAALGIGLSVSALAVRYIRRRLLFIVLVCLLAEGLTLMAISGSRSIGVAFMLYVLLSLASGLGNACLDTLVMRETPAWLQPALFGTLAAVSGTLMGLSMLFAGWLLDRVEPRTLGFAGGAGFAFIALLLAGYAAVRQWLNRRPRAGRGHSGA
ncbi:MFS transporter [Paenibacillus sp. NFR01]|uniref:MFS transporter n=1 Tax=Paenibacillus sp. NFR01 TaxID=1566279 RepID=UPI0008B96E48|nr:MFS transporter [Paenibacillus sp. NFR01]SEU28977.1 Predicted arabinose efflux permease, MFS family [Paenibacillus sp. NFR01]